MKNILFLFLLIFMSMSCDRSLDFETVSTTEPALEVIVEGGTTESKYTKIEGATVTLFSSSNSQLAETMTNAEGKVLFTKEQLKEKGVFKVKVKKGSLIGEGETAYLLLNDGVTLLIVAIQ